MAALVLAVAFVAGDSAVRLAQIGFVTRVSAGAQVAPRPDTSSPTGLERGQHRLVLPAQGTDGYHWVMQTERMLAGDGLRIRETTVDNAPHGREVHWSFGMRWWLAGAAAAVNLAQPGPGMALAVEQAVTWAGTLLFVLLVIALARVLARRLGAPAAALFALGCVTSYPIYQSFVVGFFDHHGPATLACFAAVMFIVMGGAGWVRPGDATADDATGIGAWLPAARSARRWFVASAVAAATGMWLSASTMIPVLAGIGAAALASGAAARRAPATPARRLEPDLWRTWGLAGGAASMAFYLLEYAPAHMGLRLEVNHPLYALAWLGAADLIARVLRRVAPAAAHADGERKTRDVVPALLAATAVLLLPAAILIGGPAVFRVSDPFLWALHRDHILEFRGLASQLAGLRPLQVLHDVGTLSLILVPAAFLLWPRRSGPVLSAPHAAMLLVAAIPAALLVAMTFHQVRWLGMASTLALAVLVTLAGVLVHTDVAWTTSRRIAAGAFLALLLLPFPVMRVQQWRGDARYGTATDLLQVVTRDVAYLLRARIGDEPGVVLSAPTSTTWLAWFGGHRGIGTLYWENVEGLRAAAAIYGAPDAAAARARMQERGVTHIVVFSWDPFVREYTQLQRGEAAEERAAPGTGDAFMAGLLRGDDVPPWLARIPYDVPRAGMLQQAGVWIYEVVPD